MSGGALATKGLISGGSAAAVAISEVIPLPPSVPLSLGSTTPAGQVLIVVPTAPNVCLMAAENIVSNMRVQQPASLTLPSMYKRAFLIAYETDEIALVRP